LAIAVVVFALVAFGGLFATYKLTHAEPAKPRTANSGTEETAAKDVGKLLKLGTFARISSNYRVAVTELKLFVGGETQYLAATIEAEYTGSDEGEPWGDLTVEFSRPGSRITGESDCPIDVDDASKPPPLAPGETGTHSVCIYLPSKKIDDGRISVEEALAKGGRKAYWSTKGAETEVLPPFAPPPSGVRQPNTSFKAPKANGVDEEWVEEYIEEVEEYKDWVAEMNEFAEENKDNPGFDEDDIEKYEEWKKEYDEQIEDYEKWKKEYEASR
jgi:hypothetical protein